MSEENRPPEEQFPSSMAMAVLLRVAVSDGRIRRGVTTYGERATVYDEGRGGHARSVLRPGRPGLTLCQIAG